MSAVIRRAALSDYEAICVLFDGLDQLHRERRPDLYRQPPDGVSRSPGYIASLVDNPQACFLVADDAGQVIGLVVAFLRETPPVPIMVPRRFAFVDDLVVRPDRRRQGVAQALMQAVEEWASGRDVQSVDLNVFTFNESAIRFYEGLGYQTVTQRMAKMLPLKG